MLPLCLTEDHVRIGKPCFQKNIASVIATSGSMFEDRFILKAVSKNNLLFFEQGTT